jgi:hypothetical protein
MKAAISANLAAIFWHHCRWCHNTGHVTNRDQTGGLVHDVECTGIKWKTKTSVPWWDRQCSGCCTQLLFASPAVSCILFHFFFSHVLLCAHTKQSVNFGYVPILAGCLGWRQRRLATSMSSLLWHHQMRHSVALNWQNEYAGSYAGGVHLNL